MNRRISTRISAAQSAAKKICYVDPDLAAWLNRFQTVSNTQLGRRRSRKETGNVAFSAMLEPPPKKVIQLLLSLKFSIPNGPLEKNDHGGIFRKRHRAERIAPTCPL